MQTIKTITKLALAASLGAAVNLVSQAAFARNGGGNQEHNDHQENIGMRTGNDKDSAKPGAVTWGGSPPRSPPRAGTVTWGGSPPRSPAPVGKGLQYQRRHQVKNSD